MLKIEAEVLHWVYISGTEKRPPPPPVVKPAPKSGGGFLSLFGFGSRASTPAPPPPPPEPEKTIDPLTINKTSVTLSIFSAAIDVKLDAKTSSELQRSTKKRPPAKMKYDLIYVNGCDSFWLIQR